MKITNPGNTDINSAYPLKFSLPEDGIFKEDGNNNSATGTIVVNCDEENLKKNTNLSIGLQAPHTITFKAENATISKASIKVWHKNTVGTIPTVKEADAGVLMVNGLMPIIKYIVPRSSKNCRS